MPFSFPSSPTVGQQSVQNGRTYQWDGYAWNLVNNISTHASTHAASGSDPINIDSSQVSNFSSSVSGVVSGVYAPLAGASFTGTITSPSGNFTNNLQIGSNNLTNTNTINIINSTNIYLWSNFR